MTSTGVLTIFVFATALAQDGGDFGTVPLATTALALCCLPSGWFTGQRPRRTSSTPTKFTAFQGSSESPVFIVFISSLIHPCVIHGACSVVREWGKGAKKRVTHARTETDKDRQRQTQTDKDRQRPTKTDTDRHGQTRTDGTDGQRLTDRLTDRN